MWTLWFKVSSSDSVASLVVSTLLHFLTHPLMGTCYLLSWQGIEAAVQHWRVCVCFCTAHVIYCNTFMWVWYHSRFQDWLLLPEQMKKKSLTWFWLKGGILTKLLCGISVCFLWTGCQSFEMWKIWKWQIWGIAKVCISDILYESSSSLLRENCKSDLTGWLYKERRI